MFRCVYRRDGREEVKVCKEIEAAPADAILGLTEAFKKDTNPKWQIWVLGSKG